MAFKAAGIGEILWDMLPEGKKLGGAPANFAYHFKALGGESITISRVGDDDMGREALAILKKHALDIRAVTVDPVHPTGRVDVTVDAQGVASYEFPDHVAWDFIEANDAARAALPALNAVCFGTLAQRSENSRSAILSLLGQLPGACLKIYDINLRKDFYTREIIENSLALADVLKINDEELDVVGPLLGFRGDQQTMLRGLVRHFSLKLGVLTRGGSGSLLLTADKASDFAGMSVRISDTIGAGDSFTAAMALAWLKGRKLDEINRYASEVAAYVCTQAGAMPPMPSRLSLNAQ
ncbi:carbohydrate kinase family protein [Salidesulfovibrio onnuriiensis]|uniref:carbohydrate kinase family protein n=1 Tax=Salidesulfovibrio onnuriiensis TaxID=2583823 RepID=UPI0011CA2850|nr:carbohydrate kinase [Salidesulfovibrio onnuriiensis]